MRSFDILSPTNITPPRFVLYLVYEIVPHDSCYLSRWNGIVQPPRDLLNAMNGGQLTEMRRIREKGFCCGAGGGRMFMEETLGKRTFFVLYFSSGVAGGIFQVLASLGWHGPLKSPPLIDPFLQRRPLSGDW